MKNNTKIRIPKKYQHMLTEVDKDSDGYWAYSEYGYRFSFMESHTAHEDTQKELLSVIDTLEECNCDECNEFKKE
ncbi:hypothetical protein [Oceanobacillus timonensis]|uniref:hypothetical protein n=1 Tax=Oceanobacillus timonensis TaxID=1926285 RepID=UPI0009B9ED2F|nr:hypothetical protein [Oceanobacillus timonensis]